MTESRELDGIHFLFPVGEKTPEKGQKSFSANYTQAIMSSLSRASNIGTAPRRTVIWRSWGLLPTAPKIPR